MAKVEKEPEEKEPEIKVENQVAEKPKAAPAKKVQKKFSKYGSK